MTEKLDDPESWLLDAGDAVIRQKAARGPESLSPWQKAVYCLWVVDYALRNAGSFDPIVDIYPNALQELAAFASDSQLELLSAWLADPIDEQAFCESYYQRFDAACLELRHHA